METGPPGLPDGPAFTSEVSLEDYFFLRMIRASTTFRPLPSS
jgi:hypothetical protein